MTREQIIAELLRHEAELRSAGIMRLSLFGSRARGDGNAESDVDLMAEFDEAKTFTILGRVHLENRLADLPGVRVDPGYRKLAASPM